MNIKDYTKATVPGVGKFSIFNLGALFSLLLGLTALGVIWSYATSWAARTRGFLDQNIGGRFGASQASAPPTDQWVAT